MLAKSFACYLQEYITIRGDINVFFLLQFGRNHDISHNNKVVVAFHFPAILLLLFFLLADLCRWLELESCSFPPSVMGFCTFIYV